MKVWFYCLMDETRPSRSEPLARDRFSYCMVDEGNNFVNMWITVKQRPNWDMPTPRKLTDIFDTRDDRHLITRTFLSGSEPVHLVTCHHGQLLKILEILSRAYGTHSLPAGAPITFEYDHVLGECQEKNGIAPYPTDVFEAVLNMRARSRGFTNELDAVYYLFRFLEQLLPVVNNK